MASSGFNFGSLFGSPAQIASMLIPGLCTQVGLSLKNKDDNSTGNDDAGGNVIIALGPVIPAFLSGNTSIIRKVLIAVRDTIDGYLAQNPQSSGS